MKTRMKLITLIRFVLSKGGFNMWAEIGSSIFIGAIIGCAAETIAARLSLWKYKRHAFIASNIVFMFGISAGLVAVFFNSLVYQFIFFAAMGTVYEVLNFKYLKWWKFPENKLGPFKGEFLICVVLAPIWGVVPILIGEIVKAMLKY